MEPGILFFHSFHLTHSFSSSRSQLQHPLWVAPAVNTLGVDLCVLCHSHPPAGLCAPGGQGWGLLCPQTGQGFKEVRQTGPLPLWGLGSNCDDGL